MAKEKAEAAYQKARADLRASREKLGAVVAAGITPSHKHATIYGDEVLLIDPEAVPVWNLASSPTEINP